MQWDENENSIERLIQKEINETKMERAYFLKKSWL
jgi:hypothetical protein